MPKTSLKNLAVNLALALGSVLAVLVLAEAAMRVGLWWREQRRGGLEERLERSRKVTYRDRGEVNMSGLVEASPWEDIVYRLKPGLSGTFRGAPFAVNSRGLRDREHEPAKPPGVYRIAGLGDSVMFGWGVDQESPYMEVLERRLNALPGPHPVFETLNFAVPGYNAAIEAAVLERLALPFSPDLVVIQFVNNDFGVPSFLQMPRDPFDLGRSFLAESVARRLHQATARDADLVGNQLRDVEGEQRRKVLDRYRYMVGEEGYRRAMERLASLTTARGIPVIVILGTASRDQARVVARTCRRLGFHLVRLGPYTEEFLKRLGIPKDEKSRREAMWVSPVDPHPNARAHTVYAEAVLDQMRKLGIVR